MIEFKEVYQTNHMRIGNTTNNEYFLELNQINEKIQKKFLSKINDVTRSVKCDVMLGDSTTKQIDTFDIKNVEDFFSKFTDPSKSSFRLFSGPGTLIIGSGSTRAFSETLNELLGSRERRF